MWYWEKMSRSVLDKACGVESTRPYDVFVLVVQKYKLKRKLQDESKFLFLVFAQLY